jgi:hypothetical protein
MSYVIVSVVSLFIGCTVGVITLALCVASKSIEEQEKENDCFGNCEHCTRNEGEKNEE